MTSEPMTLRKRTDAVSSDMSIALGINRDDALGIKAIDNWLDVIIPECFF